MPHVESTIGLFLASAIALPLALVSGGCDLAPEDGDAIDDSFLGAGGKTDAFGVDDESIESVGVLNFVNRAKLRTLIDDVGLTEIQADYIIQDRDFYDRGKGETPGFRTLHELDQVPWVGSAAFGKLLDHASATGWINEGGIPSELTLDEGHVDFSQSDNTIATLTRNPDNHRYYFSIYNKDNSGWAPVHESDEIRFARSTAYKPGNLVVSGDLLVLANPDTARLRIFERNEGGSENWGLVKEFTVDQQPHSAIQYGSMDASEDLIAFQLDNHLYLFERDRGGTDNWGQRTWLHRKAIILGKSHHKYVTHLQVEGDNILYKLEGAAILRSRNKGGANFWGERARVSTGAIQLDGDAIYTHQFLRREIRVYKKNKGGVSQWGEDTAIEINEVARGSVRSFAVRGNTLAVATGEGTVETYTRASDSAEWTPAHVLVQTQPIYNDTTRPQLVMSDEDVFVTAYSVVDRPGSTLSVLPLE